MNDSQLDEVLKLQLIVAWAGETNVTPPRLGWWRTGMSDEFGGEDLLRRLTPKTWEWAVLESCRAAAVIVDDAARRNAEDADHLVSLYRLGYEVDERLDERLYELKLEGKPPTEVFPEFAELCSEWSQEHFESWVRKCADTRYTGTAIGRRIIGEIPADLSVAARQLVAALAPVAGNYGLPHFRLAR